MEGAEQEFEEMDLDELSLWLVERDIPLEFCKLLKDNYVDGKEFVRLSREDIAKMIPPVGMANKIARLQEKVTSKSPPSDPVTPNPTALSQSSKSTITSPGSVTSVTTPSSVGQNDVIIPSNWSGATQRCITDKKLNVKVRCDIVRTLVTLLVAKHGPRPKKCEVEHVARQLILKYPFMRDDIGTGYASWYEKLLERLRNIRKRSKSDDVPAAKKSKGTSSVKQALMKRYPVRVQEDREEDAESIQQHISAMVTEMSKRKPREHVLLPLLKSTFSTRRDYVTSADRAGVKEILEEYPALHFPSAIEQDMSIMFDGENIKQTFQTNWNTYVTAILTYTAEQTWPWRLSLDPSDSYSQQSVALKCLAQLFKCTENLLFNEIKEDEELSEFLKKHPARSSPRMITTTGGAKYHIVVEQQILCESSSFSQCLFLLLSSFYVLHLEYPEKCKKVLLFLQDYVLGHPDTYQSRRGTYLALASDIKRCKDSE